jgi:hypothetical protein
MPSAYRLSIITVNFNGFSDTCALIESLPVRTDMEVIVVDNGSRVDEAAQIAARYPQVHAIRSEQNLGFAGGNNLGIQASTGQYLFFINNDTEFIYGGDSADKTERDQAINAQIDALIQRMEGDTESGPANHAEIGMICPKIRFFWGSRPIQFAGFTPLSRITLRNRGIGYGEEERGQYDDAHPTPYAHGAAMMVRRSALDQVGLMPECYFLYYEELDWSVNFTRHGYEIWYDPCCTIYHKESRTTGQDSPLKIYYISRNRLLFAQRNITAPVRYLTYAYLIGIVAVRDLLKLSLHGRFAQCKALLSGLSDFVKGRQGYRSFSR